jgi:C1A family cysteine protease
MAILNLDQLNQVLRDVDARWTARQPQREHRLGFVPGPTDHTLETREQLALSNHKLFMAAPGAAAAATAAPAYPTTFDWRNVAAAGALPAGNYVTDIKDQGDCGSCVAFGTCAAMETALRIKAQNPNLAVDLSEADLFYCHAEAEQNRQCDGPNGGWWPDAALACAHNPGVVDEACFPYTSGDQACNKCADWNTRLTTISASQKITDPTAMKQWISGKGPLITVISVYDDFQSYQSGVYHHVSGSLQGGHCICCVGYDDAKRFWICKNSWNDSWGEQGFVNLAYGQVGVDAAMWALQL